MKDFIGQEVVFTVSGKPFKAMMVGDTPTFVLVRGADGKTTRIVKTKIDMFTPDHEPETRINLQVLFCENPGIGCPGVQLVCAEDGVNRKSIDVMNSACSLRSKECKCGTKGDIRCVDGAFLKRMMDGMLFGEFPKKKGVTTDAG